MRQGVGGREMKNIFLIGYMGTGKSTVAACMAKQCGMEVLEMDQMIAEREGTGFLAASDYIRANEADNEHMDAEGHRIFASVLCEKLAEMGVI